MRRMSAVDVTILHNQQNINGTRDVIRLAPDLPSLPWPPHGTESWSGRTVVSQSSSWVSPGRCSETTEVRGHSFLPTTKTTLICCLTSCVCSGITLILTDVNTDHPSPAC